MRHAPAGTVPTRAIDEATGAVVYRLGLWRWLLDIQSSMNAIIIEKIAPVPGSKPKAVGTLGI